MSTTGTNSFDAYLYTYFWKGELEPGFADLEKLVPSIESAPPLGLDDYPGQVVEVYGRSNGKLIGLPVLGDATMFVWNRAQYTEAGLDPAAAPKSWEEVVANGQKLEAAGKNGFGLPAGKGYQVACLWMILFAKYGGEYFGPNFAPQFTSDAALKATKFMVDQLQPLAPKGNLTWDFSEMLDGLATGVSAQGMMWPGGFGRMLDPKQSAEADNLAYEATPDASLLGGWAVGVNDNSANKEAAALWAAYLGFGRGPEAGPGSGAHLGPQRSRARQGASAVPGGPPGTERQARPVPERSAVGAGRRLPLRRAQRRDQRRQVGRGCDGGHAESDRAVHCLAEHPEVARNRNSTSPHGAEAPRRGDTFLTHG